MTDKIVLKRYNYDTKTTDTVGEVSQYDLSNSLTLADFGSLMDDFLNRGGKGMREGVETGRGLRNTHRTIQRSIVCFCLGIIMGLAEQEYTDARNESAIATAKKIKSMVEDGELSVGMYV